MASHTLNHKCVPGLVGHSRGHPATELTRLPVMVIAVAVAILSVGGCSSETQQVRAVLLPSGCPLYLQWANTLSYPLPQSRGRSSFQDPIPLLYFSHSGPFSVLSLCLVKAGKMRYNGTVGERWWKHVGAKGLGPQSMQNDTCAPAGVSELSFAPDGACSRLARSPAGRQKKRQ